MKTTNNNYTRHLLPVSMTKKSFQDTLQKQFLFRETGNNSDEFTLLDSFGWGLYFNGLTAIRQKNQIMLWRQDNLFDPEQAQIIDNTNINCKFWWQLFKTESSDDDQNAADLKNTLKKALDLRAIMPVYDGILKIQQFNLQNNDGKILVHGQFISVHAADSPRIPLIRQVKLIPVTGYHTEHKQAIELLNELGGFKPQSAPMNTLFSALGINPQPFTIKPKLAISKQTPSRTAISIIIATLIEKQRLTENGIIKDIDTEFLHHFRVALRMIRAAVAQLKVVFPEQDVIDLKDRFGALARNTNLLRDIDVFILEKEYYLGLIPKSMRDGLIPMFDDFEKNRKTEVKRISKWLSGKTYQQEITKLESLFINGYSALETQWSEKPCIDLAINKIQKRYKVIQKAAASITSDTPDEAIHSIRIDCKKLRYLLYFFGDLFDKKQVKIAANHLKSLQDKLGIFNDLSVQGEFLENYLYKIEHKPEKDILLIAALGGLIAILHSKQLQERQSCIEELAVFSNEQNRSLFKTTFVL